MENWSATFWLANVWHMVIYRHGGNCTADIRGFLCECPPGTAGSNCQIGNYFSLSAA